ncbi:C40 family peptidase [Fodinicola feengrottensis]|uniref:NlpC/P60 domain-containing protein n=1 Tax=Fodinicola feengrottensis TaxID=435914 RepID=A0ABN2FRB7_9ACTN|nr:C40 family peptidase [Fodinicola feengrottensis]
MSKPLLVIALPLVLILVAALAIAGRLGLTGGSTGGCVPALPPDIARTGITAEMFNNAATIVTVGQQMRISQRGWVIAVATAMQESSLTNTSGGDRDSVGLFQQRPSQGWGTPAQLQDTTYASQQFYRKLLTIPGWQTLPLTVAAQAVERSGYPDAYAKHEPLATRIVMAIATSVCPMAGPFGQRVVAYAKRLLGTPYEWGAGGYSGATGGHIDCSGLTMYAIYQASSGKIRIPHVAGQQVPYGHIIPNSQMAPGDLIFFYTPGDATGRQHHVAIYLGMLPTASKSTQLAPWVIHAPDVGQSVKEAILWHDRDVQTAVRYG